MRAPLLALLLSAVALTACGTLDEPPMRMPAAVTITHPADSAPEEAIDADADGVCRTWGAYCGSGGAVRERVPQQQGFGLQLRSGLSFRAGRLPAAAVTRAAVVIQHSAPKPQASHGKASGNRQIATNSAMVSVPSVRPPM